MLRRLRSSLCRVLAGGSPFGPTLPATRNSSPGLAGFAVRHVSPPCHASSRARSFVMACLPRATAALARQVSARQRARGARTCILPGTHSRGHQRRAPPGSRVSPQGATDREGMSREAPGSPRRMQGLRDSGSRRRSPPGTQGLLVSLENSEVILGGLHWDCSNGCSVPFAGKQGSEVAETFRAKDLIITPATVLKEKPDPESLVFGATFTDHMLTVEWSSASGWEKPHIKPLENLSIHPAASVLHYAVELFEGLKAFRGVDNKIRLFRPDLNMNRMCRSAMRSTLPLFDKEELLECIQKLIQLDQEWVPYSTSASLYIRPTFIGTEQSLGVKKPSRALLFVILSPVGPYFSSGTFNPVSLWANPKYVRAWEGGTGDCKMGGNYGGSLLAQCEAVENGCQQVLWLYGKDNQITEVGTMNLFLYWINEDGEEELATPPLDGIILPGVTRQSIIELAQQWGEFKVSERYLTMADLTTALEGTRVKEMFGSGTACIVCPISDILYKGQMLHIPTMENGPKLARRILGQLTDIQYGRVESDWTIVLP